MLFGIQFTFFRGHVLSFLDFVHRVVGRYNIAYRFLGAELTVRFNVRSHFGRTRDRQTRRRRFFHPLRVFVFRLFRQSCFVSRSRVRDLLYDVLPTGRPSLAHFFLSCRPHRMENSRSYIGTTCAKANLSRSNVFQDGKRITGRIGRVTAASDGSICNNGRQFQSATGLFLCIRCTRAKGAIFAGMPTASFRVLITSQAGYFVSNSNGCGRVGIHFFPASARYITRFDDYNQDRDIPVAFAISDSAYGPVVMVGGGVLMFSGNDPFS